MEIQIYGPEDDVSKIIGLTIVIDVFRAFSMAYYINANNPLKYLVVNDVDLAFALKEKYGNAADLIGERQCVKVKGFAYGNSPTEIVSKSFENRIIVHTTTAGTKGLMKQPWQNEVIVGSFVNCQALIDYVAHKKVDTVNLYCTASRGVAYGEEDYIFATYLKNRLENRTANFEEIVMQLRKGSGSNFNANSFAPYSDFLYCMDYGRFDAVLRRKKIENESNIIELEEVWS